MRLVLAQWPGREHQQMRVCVIHGSDSGGSCDQPGMAWSRPVGQRQLPVTGKSVTLLIGGCPGWNNEQNGCYYYRSPRAGVCLYTCLGDV